jgi:hypothetical protein
MSSNWKKRPSPSMMVSLLALAVASAGTATAATLLTGANIKDGSITGKDIKNKSITAADVKGIVGAKGATGLAGAVGPAGAAGVSGAAGVPGTSVFDASIPSGKSVRGTWGNFVTLGAGDNFGAAEAFPVLAPVPLEIATVKFGVNGPNGLADATFQAATVDGDESGLCTGNYVAPSAPAGMLCVYIRTVSNIFPNSLDITRLTTTAADAQANRAGFRWQMSAQAANDTNAGGIWIYTAP